MLQLTWTDGDAEWVKQKLMMAEFWCVMATLSWLTATHLIINNTCSLPAVMQHLFFVSVSNMAIILHLNHHCSHTAPLLLLPSLLALRCILCIFLLNSVYFDVACCGKWFRWTDIKSVHPHSHWPIRLSSIRYFSTWMLILISPFHYWALKFIFFCQHLFYL